MSNALSTDRPQADHASGPAGGRRRLFMALGGAAVLLVLGLGAYFLLLSGGEEDDLGVVPSGAAALPTDGAGNNDNGTKNKGTKGDDTVPGKVDSNFTVGRDPFEPLAAEQVVETVAPAGDTTGTSTGTSTDTSTDTTGGGQTDPVVVPTPAPTVSLDPTPTPTPTPSEGPVTSYKVTVKSVDVGKDSAVIDVNGKRYVVTVKDLFTNSKTGPFKLTRVGELPSGKDTATVVFGSDAPVELLAQDTVVFKP